MTAPEQRMGSSGVLSRSQHQPARGGAEGLLNLIALWYASKGVIEKGKTLSPSMRRAKVRVEGLVLSLGSGCG
jgi:hypothetical protein